MKVIFFIIIINFLIKIIKKIFFSKLQYFTILLFLLYFWSNKQTNKQTTLVSMRDFFKKQLKKVLLTPNLSQ